MAKDPEFSENIDATLHALQLGITDPCVLAASAHVESSSLSAALRHEIEVLFGPLNKEAPPGIPSKTE